MFVVQFMASEGAYLQVQVRSFPAPGFIIGLSSRLRVATLPQPGIHTSTVFFFSHFEGHGRLSPAELPPSVHALHPAARASSPGGCSSLTRLPRPQPPPLTPLPAAFPVNVLKCFPLRKPPLAAVFYLS